jgi:VCBS repeat-containing protein
VNGTVSLSGNTITFTPAADFNGTAGFDYTLSDGYLTSTGHVTITVKEVNDAPVANPDTAILNEDGTIDIAVLANDTRGPANESNQTLTIKSASALHGTVTINSNGTLRYRPAANYFGADTIRYTITDNGTTAGQSAPLTANGVVNVTVISVNDAPVANDQSASVTEDGKVNIKLAGSDVETPAGSLIFTITSLPRQGLLVTWNGTPVHVGDHFTGAPTLVYKPGVAREGAGSDSFKYTVTDNGGTADALSDDANVAISIAKAVNDGKVTIDSAGIVRIGGTSGNDNIVATRTGSKLQISINGKVVSKSVALSSVHEIHIWGRAGNDKINILLLDVPTLLHGGAGNDELYGGAGSSLLFGDAGNDLLVGGLANNLLVGGWGSDTLIDAFGDDVLVGGKVANNLTDDVIRQMLQQWSNSHTQNSRFLEALLPDNATDRLFDSLGDDWFVVDDDDSKTDLNPFDHDLITHV